MNIYCLEDFKVEFERLISKRSYTKLEADIIKYFFDKSVAQLSSGVRLNNSNTTPYIKKRLGGRGGFRAYFLLIIVKESLYLMFVHPKTGSKGVANITDESKAYLYKKVLRSIESGDLYQVTTNDSKTKLSFTKL